MGENGVGLTPVQENLQVAVDECNSDDPPDTDTDGDGLDNCTETTRLGTNPGSPDTDGDNISDKTEVEGFEYSLPGRPDQQWYLDPQSIDTNKDGQIDSLECPELENVTDAGVVVAPSGNACRDTDGDGTSDVFDFDNDGDGVPDIVDISPNYTGSLSSNSQSELSLNLDGFAVGEPLFVELEIRPTDQKHLWYTNNVLDWPNDDEQGQIVRVNDNTFFDLNPGNAGPKSSNGDMLLTPMLEIRIPPPSTNADNPSGGLPVVDGFPRVGLRSDPLSNWLDFDAMDRYGLTASQAEPGGEIYVYIPLSIKEDVVGETPVAWAARMYLKPLVPDWGADHRVRMVWMITALVDTCTAPGTPAGVDPDPEAFADHCTDNFDNWTTIKKVIQTYYEDFFLTGLYVQEHHGFDSAIVAQKNAVAAPYENELWKLAKGLQSAFIGSEAISPGGPRLGVCEVCGVESIADRFDDDSATSSYGADERWGIP